MVQQPVSVRKGIEKFPFFIDVVSSDGGIVVWNDAAEQLTGYTSGEILNHPHPWNLLYPDESYRQRLIVAASKQGWNIEAQPWCLTTRSGRPLQLILSLFPVSNLFAELNASRMAIGIHAGSPDDQADIPDSLSNLTFSCKHKKFRFAPQGLSVPDTAGQLSLFLRSRFIALDQWLAK